ncbi:MAG: type II pantothenate kinase [Clostridiales bacterium]|nr:type II pantothenate kinase [Clostridiales bacterium]
MKEEKKEGSAISVIIGIDIGGSLTKIVGFKDGAAQTPRMVKATDPIASLFGALGKFMDENCLEISGIERIMITGVGASFITKPIYGLQTGRVDEFLSNGLGGLYLSALNRAIIVSMGTGTAIVRADRDAIEHIGGTGIGGGTILGLSSRMLNVRDMNLVIELAKKGDLSNIDLMVKDISKEEIPGLAPDATASNFGKISDIASKNDIALGMLNFVLQTIGTLAIFASQRYEVKDAVLIGRLSTLSYCGDIFDRLGKLYDVNFIIPTYSEFATAFGAALAYNKNSDYSPIL